ncbi:MAG: putative ABC transporter permease [Clostridia bacterium]|nr:putative ABC transporter permease [Clostridia bacterium]
MKKLSNKFYISKGKNKINGFEIFLLFMVGNVLGYCVEMVYGYFRLGFWESRQSLIYGPFGLAYGLGAVMLTAFLYKDSDSKWYKQFLKGFLIGTIGEYIFSFGEEAFFGHVSWDYSNQIFNLNGRVCLTYSIYWGILGLVWARWIFPGFKKIVAKIPLNAKKVIFWILFPIITLDIIISIIAVGRYNERRNNIPPQSAFEQYIDETYPDDRMNKVYANASQTEKNSTKKPDSYLKEVVRVAKKDAKNFKDYLKEKKYIENSHKTKKKISNFKNEKIRS